MKSQCPDVIKAAGLKSTANLSRLEGCSIMHVTRTFNRRNSPRSHGKDFVRMMRNGLERQHRIEAKAMYDKHKIEDAKIMEVIEGLNCDNS